MKQRARHAHFARWTAAVFLLPLLYLSLVPPLFFATWKAHASLTGHPIWTFSLVAREPYWLSTLLAPARWVATESPVKKQYNEYTLWWYEAIAP